MRPMTFEEIQADNRKMRRFICERIWPNGTRVTLADGPEGGPVLAELTPLWDDDYGWDLVLETNDPEGVDLREVCRNFRRQEMTIREWREETIREAREVESTGPKAIRTRPNWDADLGKLWVGTLVVKAFTEAAENQRLVLAAFQEQEFRHRIDDPLSRKPGEPKRKRQRRRRDTIAGLNDDHIYPGVVYFRADGTGDGIVWDWCD